MDAPLVGYGALKTSTSDLDLAAAHDQLALVELDVVASAKLLMAQQPSDRFADLATVPLSVNPTNASEKLSDTPVTLVT